MEDDQLPTEKRSAFVFALGVFMILFGGVVALALFYDFTNVDLGGLLFLISFLCCLFIAKNLYDLTLTTDREPRSRYSLLGASQSLYTQLYQKSPVPYFVIDQAGNIASANTAAARLLGLKQQSLAGKNAFELVKTESVDHKDFLIEKFRSGIGVSDEVVWISRPDHREVWALLSLFKFENTFAEQQGLLTLVDITKQKKAENAKSEFVSLASHQLRTPIAGMKWSAELLQMDSPETLTDRQHKYLNRLMASIARMSVLVDDFLRVSRFELGSFKPDMQAVVLEKLFEDVMGEQSATTKHKGIVVQTQFDPRVTELLTDPNLLRMIVTNLYSNAVKYTPDGGTVTVSYREKNGLLQIKISDTGMGIPVNDQEQIFGKLFRASNAVRDVPDGTGLGLYIVREAVAVLRGKISFSSAEGQGTTFEIQFPYETPA